MSLLTLHVTDISAGLGNWTGSGTSPYVDAQDANYITCSTKKGVTNALKFENTAQTGTINSVIIYVRAYSADGTGDVAPLSYSINDGSSWAGTVNMLNFPNTWEEQNTGELAATFDTWDKINAAAVMLQKDNSTTEVRVDHIYMVVDYTGAASSYSVDLQDGAKLSDGATMRVNPYHEDKADSMKFSDGINITQVFNVNMEDA